MHTFKNFKNFAYAEIDLSKPMTLLIGRNGSGKSNVIEGVELLAELIKGRQVHEISDIGRGGEFEIRGSLQGCFQQFKESFEVGLKDKLSFENEVQELEYKIEFKLKPTININKKKGGLNKRDVVSLFLENESLNLKDTDTFLLMRLLEDLSLLEKNTIKVRNLVATCKLAMEFISSEPKELQREFRVEDYIKVFAFDIYPRIMRQYSPVGLNQLNRTGENISSVIYYLKQNNPDILEIILNRIKQLPEEEFVSFEFITTSDNSDVLFALKYPNGEIINAKLLSDGTLRALAILTALETVPEGSRIIIEEIDNGVHASRVHVLIEAIWEASNRRHLNTLITTHNPATLDSLTDEQLECVVVCHYDKQSQSAKLTPFFELPRVDVLLQKGKLGGLVTRNVIERYLDPEFEKEQQKIASEWLESCK